MIEEKTMVGYEQILAVLTDLCGSNRTGTLFITTSDRHAAWFVLQDGKIVSCNYSVKRGRDAIPLLKTIKAGSFRFANGVFGAIARDPLPPTEALLSEISPTITGIATPVPDVSRSLATQAPAGVVKVGSLLAEMKKELLKHLGPIAEMLLDDYIDDHGMPANGGEALAFINAMAKELRNASNAEAFIAKMTGIAS